MKAVSYKKTLFDWLIIIYNLPFLISVEILAYGGFYIAKYNPHKEQYLGLKEIDQKSFRFTITFISTLIYIAIFLL